MMKDSSVRKQRIQRGCDRRWCLIRACILCAGLLQLSERFASAQSPDKTQLELQSQVEFVKNQLELAQQRIAEEHAELLELRQQFQALKSQLQPARNVANPTVSLGSAADLQRAIADIQERQAINQAEIQVHEQEKLESASKYPVKLHGLVLLNASVNGGSTDRPVSPTIAIPSGGSAANGSLTATGRQTLLGLGATGPSVWGAHTYANLEMDFSGGTSSGSYASGGNSFRLRTASMQIAWPKTTVEAGIAPLILTPDYATSFFSIAIPAMSWSGSLWGWLPQVSVDRRLDISDNQHINLQVALADIPDAGGSSDSDLGAVSAAERSRNPATEVRTAWRSADRVPFTVGVGGYWSPHSYGATTSSPAGNFDAWAGTADWKVSLPARFHLWGSIYDGAGLGGLSAGTFKDSIQVYERLVDDEKLVGLKDVGGWAQLKFKPAQLLEFNFAFGQDNANSAQLRKADLNITNPYVGLARNQTGFGNFVFRPTSTIVISGEYRKIRSWQITGPANGANLFGLAAGYEF